MAVANPSATNTNLPINTADTILLCKTSLSLSLSVFSSCFSLFVCLVHILYISGSWVRSDWNYFCEDVQELVIVLKKRKSLSPPPVWNILETLPTLQASGKFLETFALLKTASPTTTDDSTTSDDTHQTLHQFFSLESMKEHYRVSFQFLSNFLHVSFTFLHFRIDPIAENSICMWLLIHPRDHFLSYELRTRDYSRHTAKKITLKPCCKNVPSTRTKSRVFS